MDWADCYEQPPFDRAVFFKHLEWYPILFLVDDPLSVKFIPIHLVLLHLQLEPLLQQVVLPG